MFTGIVQGLLTVETLEKKPGLFTIGLELPSEMSQGVELGASIALDGVCLTVTSYQAGKVAFDAMCETLDKTTLNDLEVGQMLNVERAAKIGDEIGGHLLSGHVYGKGKISHIEKWENNQKNTFSVDPSWMKYILPKGYIGLDGCSLTIVDTDPSGWFTVNFIPETLRRTTFGLKGEGTEINIEFDSQTQAVVDTVERVLAQREMK